MHTEPVILVILLRLVDSRDARVSKKDQTSSPVTRCLSQIPSDLRSMFAHSSSASGTLPTLKFLLIVSNSHLPFHSEVCCSLLRQHPWEKFANLYFFWLFQIPTSHFSLKFTAVYSSMGKKLAHFDFFWLPHISLFSVHTFAWGKDLKRAECYYCSNPPLYFLDLLIDFHLSFQY